MPDQGIDQIGLLVGRHPAHVFSITAIDGDGDQLVAGAPLEKAAVGTPVVAHINPEVPRHAVKEAVLCVEPLAPDLPEHKRRQPRLKLVNFVVAQTPCRRFLPPCAGRCRV
jgi:hypothetical protein